MFIPEQKKKKINKFSWSFIIGINGTIKLFRGSWSSNKIHGNVYVVLDRDCKLRAGLEIFFYKNK